MSSILKALKKAEQDGSLYRSNPDLKMNVQRIFDSKTWTSATKRTPNIQKILLSLGILVTAGIVCFYILSTPPSIKQQEKGMLLQEPEPSPVQNNSPAQNTSPATDPVVKKSDLIPEIPKISAPMLANPPAPSPVTSNITPAPENTSADKNMEEIRDDSFNIQAISWAEIPKNRIAVINNNIVSENDYIQEYRIVTIDKDEVIIEKSGKRFSLKFKYR